MTEDEIIDRGRSGGGAQAQPARLLARARTGDVSMKTPKCAKTSRRCAGYLYDGPDGKTYCRLHAMVRHLTEEFRRIKPAANDPGEPPETDVPW